MKKRKRIGILYNRWTWIRNATSNPNFIDYPNIGGQGVQCYWPKGQYTQFESYVLAKLGPPRGNRKFLTRIDITGDYEPGNLMWATGQEKGNRGDPHNQIITYRRRRMSAKDWARSVGMNYHTFRSRLIRGWSMHQTLTRPVRDYA